MAQSNSAGPTRAEKLVSLTYALINTPHGYSKAQLRKIVDDYKDLSESAFDRKFDRDKKALRDMGIPLKTMGEGGDEHYRILPESYRLPEVRFSTEEAAVLGLAAQLWKDTDFESSATRATGRLAWDGSEIGESQFSEYVPRLHASGPAFTACLNAAWAQEIIKFTYLDAQGKTTQRTVDAWGIGSRFGQWYLVGFDHTRQEQRMFRLSRIMSDVSTGAAGSPRPEGFKMANALARLDPEFDGVTAKVQIAKDSGWSLRSRAQSIIPSETHDEILFSFHDLLSTASEIAKLGTHAQVVEPQSLRNAVRAKLENAVSAQKLPIPSYKLSKRRNVGRPPSTEAVARNLDIIAYVAKFGSPTVTQTAKHFGLSEKVLLAHLQTIMMCGVPNGLPDELIDVEWETGTISINNAEALDAPIRLSLPEAATMLAGLASLQQIPDFEHSRAVESAFEKLQKAAVGFEGIDSVLSIALRSTEENANYAALIRAIREKRVVNLGYISASSDAVSERLVEPIRLVEHSGKQYLRAWSQPNEQIRSFRVDRIQHANITGKHFEITEEKHDDVEDIFFTPSANDTLVVLGFSKRLELLADEYAPEQWANWQGELIAEIRMSSTAVLPGMIAYHGGDLRVLGPESVRTQVTSWLEDALSQTRKN